MGGCRHDSVVEVVLVVVVVMLVVECWCSAKWRSGFGVASSDPQASTASSSSRPFLTTQQPFQ